MGEQTDKALAELATKLGTTVEYLWGVLLKQAKVEIWLESLAIGIELFTTVIGIVIGLKLYHKGTEMQRKSEFSIYEPWMGGGMVLWFISFICITCAIKDVMDIISLTINPDYWALQQVMALK